MLFTKDLKVPSGAADKGGVTTLAHSMMTATRSADSGPAGRPSEFDRYSYAESTGSARTTNAPAWDSGDSDMGRLGRRAAGNRGRGLHGQLVQQLGQMIVSGDLGADRPLVPEEIGQRFEVSRTVVRESLRVLEAKGLVSARPNVGTRVRPVGDWNLLDPDIIEWRAFGPQREDQRRELCELRLTIEPLAARLAAADTGDEVQQRLGDMVDIMTHTLAQGDALTFSRADAEFHALVLRSAGNRMLEHLSGIVASALQVSGGAASGCEHPTDASVALHQRIVDAIGSGEPPAAETAMRQLLTFSSDAPTALSATGADHVVPAPREH
ncbi:FadR/GntR family transcriptional regulator [Streptomyces triticirhizae]|uniref:FadR family transcriptional regulator n=1 Tax=Streptomyces triticirhizae TaxID=2483353 RepID=A0A3M2LNS8_9ACTN|nr:FadR/GntR family transcriptional regulator [Streptomyces triticirhizae]RMI36458.1 FadR family transcriptional regulator [Streptomyces triticirhizae]